MTRHWNGSRYVRAYLSLHGDYPAVYESDRLLAGWLRLLWVADLAWPDPGTLPSSVSVRTLDDLVAIGCVERVGKHGFRFRGLDVERAERGEVGRRLAARRWDARRNAEP